MKKILYNANVITMDENALYKEAIFIEDDKIALEKLSECDFVKIHKCQYISIGLGRIPVESYKKIDMHDNKFIYVNLHNANRYYWIAYATSNTYVKETLKVLESLFFEPIKIPEINVKKVIEEYLK